MMCEVLGYIECNFLYEMVIKYFDCVEVMCLWNFFYVVIEEVVVNVVYYCFYEECEFIEVCISYEELVVVSYFGLDWLICLVDLQVGCVVSCCYCN